MSSEAKKRVRQSLNEYGLWGGFKFSWSSHQHLSDSCSGEQLGFIATSARGRDKLYCGERNCAGNLWASAESRTGFATPARFYHCSFQPVMVLCAWWLSHHLGHLCALIPAQG